ncbi:autophagy protein 16, interacts with Atg12p-Atg5p [Purpureocillium takamizusanense]|uniref:Autophagy protein 16, interacts with Atg12p-Atg5p n=1 Tax=Purpureocillium takamizusanense TaxID=2060973 RepID=A0A9Q8V853_9HYPO|nr:autophagy protein 16, interacts with Atg12p-Atg5p [Purpureocillium takamizusanense]UNI16383.1 autophagy protein 16, interacts with Atg12p-Atg5p [Purpureocillium takamizusanense]
MPSWREEYLLSLQDVETKNPVNMDLVQACTQATPPRRPSLPLSGGRGLTERAGSQMADRIAALEAEKSALQSQITNPSTGGGGNAAGRKTVASSSPSTPSDDPGVSQLRVDLAESLRAKGVAESRLRTAEEELGKLRTKTKDDARSIRDLTADRASVRMRLKDQEHELREQRKLLEQVQDEMITLNLQVSVAEKERDKARKENKELVDRWMKRMAQEADAMNLANEPLFDKTR